MPQLQARETDAGNPADPRAETSDQATAQGDGRAASAPAVDVVELLVGVSLAGLCFALWRVAPQSLWASVPLCVAGYVLMLERR